MVRPQRCRPLEERPTRQQQLRRNRPRYSAAVSLRAGSHCEGKLQGQVGTMRNRTPFPRDLACLLALSMRSVVSRTLDEPSRSATKSWKRFSARRSVRIAAVRAWPHSHYRRDWLQLKREQHRPTVRAWPQATQATQQLRGRTMEEGCSGSRANVRGSGDATSSLAAAERRTSQDSDKTT